MTSSLQPSQPSQDPQPRNPHNAQSPAGPADAGLPDPASRTEGPPDPGVAPGKTVSSEDIFQGAGLPQEQLELIPEDLKLERILVPLDFSVLAEKALRYAVPLARQFSAEIVLLHVVQPLPYPSDITHMPLGESVIMDPLKERLALFAEQVIPHDLLMGSEVRMGIPYEIITDFARYKNVDLIILTTHGYTGLRHLFLGSTAERVLRYAPCPVLTVRERERDFV